MEKKLSCIANITKMLQNTVPLTDNLLFCIIDKSLKKYILKFQYNERKNRKRKNLI